MDQPSAPASPEAKEPGGASQLVADVHDKLNQLMNMVGQAGAPDDAEKLGALIQGFEAFVDGLGQPQGGPKQSAPVAMEAGASDVKPAY